MNHSNLKNLLSEYEKKRLHAIYEAEHRKNLLYAQEPRLQEIDTLLSKEAIQISKEMLHNPDKKLIEQLQIDIERLKKEKLSILKKLGKEESYLKPTYECSHCKDTGYIMQDSRSIMCNCLKQKLFDIEYNKSNIYNLQKENFNTFLSTVYAEEVDENKYHSKLSPRENIECIKKICLSFIHNFDKPDEKNLLFTGNTGLGKTFLSNCIANEILKQGKTVLYQTAPVMLDTIMDYRFGKETSSKDTYDNLLSVDLLIIDDLGTEYMNNMKFSELFNIINTRLLNANQKVTKTIISTNLSLQNLFSCYDERIVSRIVGNYHICYFFGDDIRFKKR
ncbi:MAG: ATP-binding protein [Clostridia bacterium]